jgi:hypothetical protein
MVTSIIRIVSIILNIGIIAFILGLAFRGNLEFDNIHSWVFITAAMATPLINISGLLRKPKVIKPLTALIVNTLVLSIFSFIILFVMIWPMGSKPRGAELVYIVSLYSALLFTELSYMLEIKKR